jgi:hypothetical protein
MIRTWILTGGGRRAVGQGQAQFCMWLVVVLLALLVGWFSGQNMCSVALVLVSCGKQEPASRGSPASPGPRSGALPAARAALSGQNSKFFGVGPERPVLDSEDAMNGPFQTVSRRWSCRLFSLWVGWGLVRPASRVPGAQRAATTRGVCCRWLRCPERAVRASGVVPNGPLGTLTVPNGPLETSAMSRTARSRHRDRLRGVPRPACTESVVRCGSAGAPRSARATPEELRIPTT